MFYQVGCLIAELLFAYLVDRFGRKLAHILSHLVICVVGVGTAFTGSYFAFIVLRMITGMMIVVSARSSGMMNNIAGTTCQALYTVVAVAGNSFFFTRFQRS